MSRTAGRGVPTLAPLTAALLTAAAAADGPGGPVLTVTGTEPPARAIGAAIGTSVSVHFDRALDPETVTAARYWAFGRWSGTAEGAVQLADDGRTLELDPAKPFSAGELVTVYLSHDLRGADDAPLRDGGYCFQFWTRADAASLEFAESQTLTTNGPGESSRPYGGIGSDLNGDGWLDLAVVNEDTADIRVFLNAADGTGEYAGFMEPPAAVNDRASPSEPADFDRDGIVDICVANINTSSVSILLGRGDGTFAPHQEITVGAAPRGIATLDVDGDGDVDVVNTNADSSNLSLLLNDGAGVFGPPTFFDGGGNGEWALASADMNGDGLLDLVVGNRFSQTVTVRLGQGDGTFAPASSQGAGGSVWMLVVGDVNGDGHEDVATAN
ncbi:MAG: FG-GAP-like repeat-containing protein, partial [Planctomycetota bacterium]